jgi:hypothetical protein
LGEGWGEGILEYTHIKQNNYDLTPKYHPHPALSLLAKVVNSHPHWGRIGVREYYNIHI